MKCTYLLIMGHDNVKLFFHVLTGKTSVKCGFEDAHICGFLQDKENDDFDWTWWRLNTPSVETGPVNDNTCPSGREHPVINLSFCH